MKIKARNNAKLIELANPIYLITALYLLSVIALFGSAGTNYYNWQRVFMYITLPYLLYVNIYVIFNKVRRTIVNRNFTTMLGLKKIYFINSIVSIVSICIFLNSFLYLISLYGVNTVVSGIKNLEFVQSIQRLESIHIKMAILCSNISPIVSVLMINQIKNKEKKTNRLLKIQVILYLTCIFIFANLIGARILILYPSIGCLLIYFYDLKINIKNIVKVLGLVGIIALMILIGQVNKTMGENNRVDNAKKDIVSYYTQSLNNGYYIIDNDIKRVNLGYWTIKPLFNIPMVSSSLRISELYEKYISTIPIKNREDDFIYAMKLGINPKFNTMSIYGYSYLDFGFYGVLVILIQYLILHFMYYSFVKGRKYISLIYPIIYISFFDSLRNYGIINDRTIYCIIILFFYWMLSKIKIMK